MDKEVEPKNASRSDPHRWADNVEEAMRRQSFHIVVLYVLVTICGAKLVFDLMAWADYAVTH